MHACVRCLVIVCGGCTVVCDVKDTRFIKGLQIGTFRVSNQRSHKCDILITLSFVKYCEEIIDMGNGFSSRNCDNRKYSYTFLDFLQ